MKALTKLTVLGLFFAITACSTNPFNRLSSNQDDTQATAQPEVVGANTKPGVAIGGSAGMSMDAFDRVRLSRALDKAPGKSTSWENAMTGTNYTVTPIRKISVNGNPFCREYQVEASRGDNKRESTGTACVATDGGWSEVKG